MKAPDPEWMPFAQLAVFLVTVLLIFTLAESEALGHVNQETSYGLDKISEVLSGLAIGMLGWFAGKASK